MEKTVIALVGPKGSGKTRIGELLRDSLGFSFVYADKVWLSLQKERGEYESASAREEGFLRMRKAVSESLGASKVACIESTGVGERKQNFIMGLSDLGQLIIVRVVSSEDACLRNIRGRDKGSHVLTDVKKIVDVNRQAMKVDLPWNVTLHNDPFIPQDRLLEIFRVLLSDFDIGRGLS
jgi:shikimate kinase